MHHDHALPSRRGVLTVLGAGLLLPGTVALVRSGRPPGGEADGLRVEVLRTVRAALPGHRGHEGHGPSSSRWETPSWPDLLRVDLRVRNVSPVALLVSPGQFRLVTDGLTVMPTAWQHEAAALPPGASRTGWVDYRAPRAGGPLRLDFTPAGGPVPVALPLHEVSVGGTS